MCIHLWVYMYTHAHIQINTHTHICIHTYPTQTKISSGLDEISQLQFIKGMTNYSMFNYLIFYIYVYIYIFLYTFFFINCNVDFFFYFILSTVLKSPKTQEEKHEHCNGTAS